MSALEIIALVEMIMVGISLFAASEFADIAEMKGFGHKRSRYFWWTVLFLPIGMLMVVALPDRANVRSAPMVRNDHLPSL